VIRNGVWIANSSETTYSDSGLATSTTYNYQIQAFDLAGNTSLSSATLPVSTVYTIPPTAPANVVATAYATQGIALSWSASQDPQGVSSYQILRGTSPSSLVLVSTVHGTTLSYKDYTLTASTTYYYGVEATQASYVSPMSATASAITLALPSAPANATAAANSTTQVVVSWTAGPSGMPISSYSVYRGSTPSSLVQVATRAATTYTDVSLTPGTMYYYAVQETDTGGDLSPKSATVSATTLALPSAPTKPAGTADSTRQVVLNWTAGPSGMPISSYRIYRGATPSSLVEVASRTTTTYTDVSLTPATMYYYAVQEVDTGGNLSPMSATVSVTTLALPAAPTNVTATANSTTQAVVSWTAGPSGMPISSYRIYRGTTPSTLVQVASGTTTTYTNVSLTPGKEYYYAVQETDTGGNLSPMSATVSVTTPK
jgi:titin